MKSPLSHFHRQKAHQVFAKPAGVVWHSSAHYLSEKGVGKYHLMKLKYFDFCRAYWHAAVLVVMARELYFSRHYPHLRTEICLEQRHSWKFQRQK